MFRRVCGAAVIASMIGLIGVPTASADDKAGRSPARASKSTSSSSGKRVAWTIIGAAAGFGAGVYLGLYAFDDAINSDRKVWTTAIVGAAAGGFAGAFLSRNVGRAPDVSSAAFSKRRDGVPAISWASALRGSALETIPPIDAPPSGGAGLWPEHAHDR